MRTLLFTLLFANGFIFSLYAQQDSLILENTPLWVRPVLEKSEIAQKHTILTAFNPFYLESDFNGDKIDDIAFYVENKVDKSKGIMIVNKGKNSVYVVGCGSPTDMGSSLNWTKAMFVFREKNIRNEGKTRATLKYPAIQLTGHSRGSLVVYWVGKKYKTASHRPFE